MAPKGITSARAEGIIVEVIKTWPSWITPKHTREVFSHHFAQFFFTLGRGKPKRIPEQIWFTHRGVILGSFRIREIVRNEGQLPKLTRLDGSLSEWQIKPDAWVAVCDPPFKPLRSRVYYSGFRGWRYFDLLKHVLSLDSKVKI